MRRTAGSRANGRKRGAGGTFVGTEDLDPEFDVAAIQRAMQSGDFHEKNKVAVIEREFDVIVTCLDELSSRGLAEGQRLGVVPNEKGHGMERLAELGVISRQTAERLQDAKDIRNQLAGAYPPVAWRSLHDGVQTLLARVGPLHDEGGQIAQRERNRRGTALSPRPRAGESPELHWSAGRPLAAARKRKVHSSAILRESAKTIGTEG